eukprot:scaffold50268_cov30-Tisochrysis_lutea.AAC.3
MRTSAGKAARDASQFEGSASQRCSGVLEAGDFDVSSYLDCCGREPLCDLLKHELPDFRREARHVLLIEDHIRIRDGEAERLVRVTILAVERPSCPAARKINAGGRIQSRLQPALLASDQAT